MTPRTLIYVGGGRIKTTAAVPVIHAPGAIPFDVRGLPVTAEGRIAIATPVASEEEK